MKRLLVIQNARCEHLGSLQSMFESDNFRIERFVATNDSLPKEIEGYNALIILGGPAGVYDDYEYLRNEEKLIRDAIRKNIATLGICLGSQLIAKAVGGRVYKGPRKEIGWYPVEITDEGRNDIFKGLKRNIVVFQWHGDTYDLPRNAVTLATSELYPIQAFRIGNAIGIQFHLEVSKEMVMDWIGQYKSELESVSHYIYVNDITKVLDTNINALNEYARVLYQNFRKMFI
ncbi:MAG: type 1 glutamine amidotransferase [Nitrososphaerales archaeon]